MLSITSQASEAIRGITAAPELPDGAMLRIDSDPGTGLQIGVVTEPAPGDEVVEGEAGVEVALEPSTATLLDDKRLDAAIDAEAGQVTFTISDQSDPGPSANGTGLE